MADAAVVLEENFDGDHEPEEHEILEYAEWLGIDVKVDQDLLWIARLSLRTPLPKPWKPCQSGDDGDIFYFNFETGESIWDHPCDPYFRKLYERELAKKYGKPLPPLDESDLICMPADAPKLNDDAAIAALKVQQDGGTKFTPVPKAKTGGFLGKDAGFGIAAAHAGETAASKAAPTTGAAAEKAKPATLGTAVAAGKAAFKAGSGSSVGTGFDGAATLKNASAAGTSTTGVGGAGSGTLVRDADLLRMASSANTGSNGAAKAGGAAPKAGLSSIAPVGALSTGTSKAAAPASIGSASAAKLESERKKLEEDLEKKTEELRNEYTAKLSKHRRDIMEEFNLERDKTFSELLEKHQQQIREEKQRLQQELRSKKPELQKAIESDLEGEVNLKRALEDKTREWEEATTQLDAVRSRNAEQTTEIWRLKAEKKEAEEDAEKLKKEVEEAQKARASATPDQTAKIEGLEGTIKDLKTQLEALKTERVGIEQRLKITEDSNTKLTTDLKDANKLGEEAKELRAEVATLKVQLKNQEELQSEIATMKAELQQKGELQAEVATLKGGQKKQEEEIAKLNSELKEKEAAGAGTSSELNEAREALAACREQLKSLEESSGAATRSACASAEALEGQLKSCQLQLDETGRRLQQEQAETKEAISKSEKLRNELAELKHSAELNLREAKSEVSQELNSKSQQLKYSEQDAERLRAQLQQLESSSSMLRQQHSDAEATANGLLKSEQQCQDRLEGAQNEVAALQQQLITSLRAAPKGAAGPTTTQPASPMPTLQVSPPNLTVSMMDALRNQTEEAELCRQELRELSWELEHQTSEARKNEALVEGLRSSVARLEKSEREAEDSRRREHKRLDERCQEQTSEASSLKDALERRSKELRQLELTEQRLHRRFVGCRDELEQEQLQTQHVREEMLEIDNCLTDTRSTLRGEQQARNQLEVQSRSMKREVQTLRGEIQQRTSDLDALDMELRRSRDQALDSDMATKKLQEEMRHRDNELRMLRAQRDSQLHQLQQLQQQQQTLQHQQHLQHLQQQQQQHQQQQQQRQVWWSEEPPPSAAQQRSSPLSPLYRGGSSVGGATTPRAAWWGSGFQRGGELWQGDREVAPDGEGYLNHHAAGDHDVEMLLEARRRALHQEFTALERLRSQIEEADCQHGELSEEAEKNFREVSEEVRERFQSFDRAVSDFQTLQRILCPAATQERGAAGAASAAALSSADGPDGPYWPAAAAAAAVGGEFRCSQEGQGPGAPRAGFSSSSLPLNAMAARQQPTENEAAPGPALAGGSGECPPPESDGDANQSRMRAGAGGLTQEEADLVSRWRTMLSSNTGVAPPTSVGASSLAARLRSSSAGVAGRSQALRGLPIASSVTPRSLFPSAEPKETPSSWSFAGRGASATRPPSYAPSYARRAESASYSSPNPYSWSLGSRFVPQTQMYGSARSRPFSAR